MIIANIMEIHSGKEMSTLGHIEKEKYLSHLKNLEGEFYGLHLIFAFVLVIQHFIKSN